MRVLFGGGGAGASPTAIRQALAAAVGAGRIAGANGGGTDVEGFDRVEYRQATIWEWATAAVGLAETGSAEARSRVYTTLEPVAGYALLALPTPASPELTLARIIDTAGSVVLGVAAPHASLATRRLRVALAVRNTGGAVITLHLADQAADLIPTYWHADHAAARPTVAPGATDYFEVAIEAGVAIIRKLARTPAFRRRRPTFIDFRAHTSAGGDVVFNTPGLEQAVGDLMLAADFRSTTTKPGLRAGFSNLPSGAFIPEFSTNIGGRVSFRIATAATETIGPPTSNVGSRNAIGLFRGVDPVTPFLGTPVWAGGAGSFPIPAQAVDGPALILAGFLGVNWGSTPHNELPAPFAFLYGHVVAGDGPVLKLGAAPRALSTPLGAVSIASGSASGVGFSLALQGAEIPA